MAMGLRYVRLSPLVVTPDYCKFMYDYYTSMIYIHTMRWLRVSGDAIIDDDDEQDDEWRYILDDDFAFIIIG